MNTEFKCGEYKHFKGKYYIVYGIVKVDPYNSDVEYILYRENYGSRSWWIRPASMFVDQVVFNGNLVDRFKLKKHISSDASIKNLVDICKKSNVLISHSESQFKFKIYSIDTQAGEITISPYNASSPYLTDTQLAWRIGYDLYKIDGVKYVVPTQVNLPTERKLILTIKNSSEVEYNNKQLINEINPCSIDLHISNDLFFKAKRKTIDIATMMRFSVKASELWKSLKTQKRNGFQCIVLKPGETIITRTLEYIELPVDCAGKIEIKSTYARLALSVTTSDFGNPGWKGYFPLTITNNGKHKIYLHPKEKMLQLFLVQTDGYIINEYSKKATYMNDDGTPFNFWHAQTVRHLQKENFSEPILTFYEKVKKSIGADNSDNIDDTKKRFEDTFLIFCERKLKNGKYNSYHDPEKLLKRIWSQYRHKENFLKFLFSKFSKTFAFVVALLPTSISCITNLFIHGKLTTELILFLIASLFFAALIEILMHILPPKCFCTFEKLEFDNIYSMEI